MKPRQSARGFTLVEALIVAALIGILALAAIPMLSSQDPTKLDVAAAEAGNVLRFAISEAGRGSFIWVDGSSVAGRLTVSRVVGPSTLQAVTDPLTKRDLVLDASGPAFFGTVTMAPRFYWSGTAYTQLLISPGTVPGTTQLWVYDGSTTPSTSKGPLQAGSGIVLTLGPQSVTVALNEITGRVTLP